jgi:alpha-galactosidase
MTGTIVDEVAMDPARARVYAEGWQSWSPASWHPVGGTGPRPGEDWVATMRFRPGTPVSQSGLQAEGLLVVDPGTGAPARCYGALDGGEVPTLRAVTADGRVVVRSDTPTVALEVSEHETGGEAALTAYADRFAARAGVLPLTAPPTVWCSWYRYFEDVTAGDVTDNLAALDEHDLRADVVLVDDGWSLGLGECLRPSPRFGSLRALVEAVDAAGRRAGIWLAPFLVGERTSLAREHPDWLVGYAGRNWGQDLVGLDLTHPGFRDFLRARLEPLVEMGIRYFKLDFLYAGAVPGRRHLPVAPVAAYRSGMRLLRDVLGREAYLVGCGAPILPSVGLVDAMRVSPDTFHEGGEDGSTGMRGLMPLAARTWQQGRFWVNDPDCLVARPSYRLREPWADVVTEFGGLRSCSDKISELDEWGLEATRRLLAGGSTAEPFPLERVRAGALTATAQLAAPTDQGPA